MAKTMPDKTCELTLEYKRSDEYKQLYAAVKSMAPAMPDYMVDLAIWSHKTNPTAYRDAKLHKQAAKYENCRNSRKSSTPEASEFVLNSVHISDAENTEVN